MLKLHVNDFACWLLFVCKVILVRDIERVKNKKPERQKPLVIAYDFYYSWKHHQMHHTFQGVHKKLNKVPGKQNQQVGLPNHYKNNENLN